MLETVLTWKDTVSQNTRYCTRASMAPGPRLPGCGRPHVRARGKAIGSKVYLRKLIKLGRCTSHVRVVDRFTRATVQLLSTVSLRSPPKPAPTGTASIPSEQPDDVTTEAPPD